MFKNITINLTEPVCNCAEQKLTWRVKVKDSVMLGIVIACKTCKTTLTVPQAKVLANFSFDKPHPSRPKKVPVKDPDDKDWN